MGIERPGLRGFGHGEHSIEGVASSIQVYAAHTAYLCRKA
jgi:hypothetical protein